ncbi:MAG: putative baseplate assembly protein [Planctomycetes bacterium]|nr:putative baseplate assembly protein [Planctomycetota bacterium]
MTATNCCGAAVPEPVPNRPGLSSIVYRTADHGAFAAAMHRALRARPALRGLGLAGDDPSIALLDAWAVTLDVLTFYQERIANEHYLRTAVERGSVLELARQIGYELRPGVAAGTYLAFQVESTTPTGAPSTAEIPIGTRAQSVPGQDELPQIFETIEDIHARAAWNDLRARTSAPFTPIKGDTVIYLKGVTTNLGLGDGLLLVGSEREADPTSDQWDFRRVIAIELDRENDVTTITLDHRLGSYDPHKNPSAAPKVYALRTRAAHFGHNAPDWNVLPAEVRDKYGDPAVGVTHWSNLTIAGITGDESGSTLYLDRVYTEIVEGSWIVVASPSYAEVYEVKRVVADALTGFALSGKSTQLSILGENLDKCDTGVESVRRVVIHGQSELLEQAERPLTEPVAGNVIELSRLVEGLEAGRLLVVRGTDTDGQEVEEIAEIHSVDEAADPTRLILTGDLLHSYVRGTVRINANVARATHGEARTETLGSGDGAAAFQTFTLANSPLTHTAAANTRGHDSTLELRVDGVRWDEVDTLYGQPPDAMVYERRLEDDGTTIVRFGDGVTGARLPTGTENVTASYRIGSGLEGHIAANQIKLLINKPLGVKSVSNPLAPSGGDDREALADARANAPLTVLTLDRVVSLRDLESFARAYPGIGKARVARLWNGTERFAHITVAGVDGAEVSGDTVANLLDSLAAAWHGAERIETAVWEQIEFSLSAKLIVDAAHVRDDVLAAATAVLLDAFSFARRALGQGVTAGEIMAVLQGVDGVIAVDLDTLNGLAALQHPRLLALTARYEGGVVLPAQLVVIDGDGISLEAVSS